MLLWLKQYIKKLRAVIQYNDYYKASKQELLLLVNHYSEQEQKVAIWGGGLKGISFLNCIDPKATKIECVVDMNKSLQGSLTATGHRIVGDEYLLRNHIDTIWVMNKVYFVDVYLLLQKRGFRGSVIDIDEMIEKRMKSVDIIDKKFSIEEEEKDSVFGYSMKDIQMTAFQILNEVDRICQKNNIRYFLEAGSALGVVRYQGFIPCDDDIDIGMFREDYNVFKKIAEKELKPGFLVQELRPGYDYPYPYIQVVKDHTSFVRKEFRKACMHHGIHIDIAPIDKVPEDSGLRKQQIEKIRKYSSIIRKKLIPELYESKNPFKNFIVNSPYYLLKVIPLRHLIKKQQKEFIRYQDSETEYVGDLCTHYKKDIYFKKDVFFPTALGEFEGKLFPVPKNMDKYLTVMYDDYKMLSPREDGSFKYRLVDVSLERNYNESGI